MTNLKPASVKVTPRCSACQTAVDLTDDDYHVCIKIGGEYKATTLRRVAKEKADARKAQPSAGDEFDSISPDERP